jgi:hypothetical protein
LNPKKAFRTSRYVETHPESGGVVSECRMVSAVITGEHARFRASSSSTEPSGVGNDPVHQPFAEPGDALFDQRQR